MMKMSQEKGCRLVLAVWILMAAASISCSYAAYDDVRYASDKDYKFQCYADGEVQRSVYVTPKHKHPVGIQVTRRATHQLISRIFAIFVREILGFQNVTLVNLDLGNAVEHFKLLKTLMPMVSPFGQWPYPAMDLEVWMPPDYHALPAPVTTAGLVTQPGRFGWFVPTQLLQNHEQQLNVDMQQKLHYSLFQNPNFTQFDEFAVDRYIMDELNSTFGPFQHFKPEHCQKRCVTLFAEYYGDTSFIEQHISEFRFYVEVVWIGDHYKKAINWLLHEYSNSSVLISRKKKFLLLHWTPSDIISAGTDYTSITMPKCEDIHSASKTLCKYELIPLLKCYALQFRPAHSAYEALQNFNVSSIEMKMMLMELNRKEEENNFERSEEIYDQIACSWLKRNKNAYSNWVIPQNVILNIGGIFPMSEKTGSYRNITKAVAMAVEAVNANESVLPHYNLSVQITDGECRSDVVMKRFMYFFSLRSPFLGILGPACSDTVEPIVGISKHAGIPMISYSAEGVQFTNREDYPYFFQTIGSNKQYEIVYLELFDRLKWRRVAALTEDGKKYTEYISHMESLFKKHDKELITNKKFPKDITTSEMNKRLLDLKKKNARIIIADIYNDVAQVVMCEAYKLEMTSYHGYVWFLPVWLSKNWMNGTQIKIEKNVSCTPRELFQAINGHFSLSHAPFADDNATMQENKTVHEWKDDYQKMLESTSISDYSGFAYDAVWVYALAAHKLLKNDPQAVTELFTPNYAKKFTELVWQTDMNGLSGRIRFGEGGARINDVIVLQWINGNFTQVGKYYTSVNGDAKIDGGTLKLNESAIVWLWNEGRPNDGQFVCGFGPLAEFLNTDCENVVFIVIAFVCLFVIALISIASFWFWKRRYDEKLKLSAKVMRNFGIDLLSPSSNMNNTLDKWEVPKEKIVINRRLGEGAFGTVYGGEAQFSDNGWTAVAVKTLKAGASTEDRLDFLSEAEAMKRFDHKNVVQLLGVCLQTEPIYTIMEFMLYGDLKTYLLARRHLVNEKVTDDSDISSKRLTMMALDVARGLSYLASLKYVHRDIACRNCLVNAQRVTKIGDFGMARPMFENNYYRFNRKGMLPVRWMAPESLGLGLFTPLSDVWSFGILLYEIITFGSFPYQGLTNSECLEHIKNGKTLTIPPGTKPHLEALMKACWNQEYKKRPSANEIVDYISNYPRLLTPCLDVPISSVQFPETESDQLELLPGSRKRSSTQPNLDILTRASNINNFDQQRIEKEVDEIHNRRNNIHIQSLNVLPDASVDENISNTYNPVEPLLKQHENPSIFGSNNSLRRYVPMYSIGRKNTSNLKSTPNSSKNNISQSTSVL